MSALAAQADVVVQIEQVEKAADVGALGRRATPSLV
jgi:hypothetical protein